MIKAITAREARKIYEENGIDYGEDGRTFYAVDTDHMESCYEFDSKKERDEFIKECNS